jgi:hypothetical protein
MADDQNVVKRIVWSEIFSFPHIFKSFRMATQPHKLALAFVAIVLLFVGGMVLDSIWSISDNGTAMKDEILLHVSSSSDQFDMEIEKWQDGRELKAASLLAATKNDRRSLSAWRALAGIENRHFREAFEKLRKDYVTTKEQGDEFAPVQRNKILEDAEKNDDDWDDLIDQAEDAHDYELEKIEDILNNVEDQAVELIKNDPSLKNADEDKQEENIEKAEDNLELAMIAARRAITFRKLKFQEDVKAIEGNGIFESFISYERDCIYNGIMAVRYLNFTGGLAEYQKMVAKRTTRPASMTVTSGLPDVATIGPKDDQPGLLCFILLAVEGVRWMILQNWVFAVIFLLWALAIWSLFGGAMYRIAAIRFARDEKISFFQALQFSRQKFFSFFSAPLVPLVVIFGTGILLMIGGLIGAIPFIGPLLMGILFGIAILMGIGIAFMAIGLIAGGPMLYPTIAVEGSDCFDAISRSFTYVFSRPFRAIFYGVVAAIYGTLTYLFVRLFAYIALCSVHCFAKWGVIGGGNPIGANADKLDVLWPKPTFWNLHQFNWAAMGGWDSICAILIAIWVLILVGLVASYVLTFFVSASTSIYFILRRRVDATDFDDVYVEEEEELLPQPEAAAETTPAEEKAEEKPAEEKSDKDEKAE